jgi:hypothetical protein
MAQSKTSWKPGQSGNPKGRAKKDQTLTDILKKYSNKKGRIEINGKQLTNKEALAFFLWEMAVIDKNLSAIKYIYDRTDGFPLQMEKIEAAIEIKEKQDLSRLTTEEVEELERLTAKMEGKDFTHP